MLRIILFVLVAGLALPASAQRPQGALECKATGTDFVYACTIRLTQGGKPLRGVKISVGADMPSMPMAHIVKPVVAKPTAEPGVYQATLDLEMLGLWVVKLRLSGPVRDQLNLRYEFDNQGATPAKAGTPGTMPHGAGTMPHGAGGMPGGAMQHGAPTQQGK